MPNKPASAGNVHAVMRALSSPVRREILGLIWDTELAAGEIAGAFELTKPTISQHLGVLRDAGLVTMVAAGTSRRYRARQDALHGLHGALQGARKWEIADDLPAPAGAVEVRVASVVTASVDVDTDQSTTFHAFIDPRVYSRWLGVPVSIDNGRFAATMEWGTEVRGTYALVAPPELIVMQWNFEDETVPVPGDDLTGYLRVRPRARRGSTVEVHQLVESPAQAAFMQTAWALVLDRLRAGVVAASNPSAAVVRRPRRAKRRSSA